jgi:hypothetical protein
MTKIVEVSKKVQSVLYFCSNDPAYLFNFSDDRVASSCVGLKRNLLIVRVVLGVSRPEPNLGALAVGDVPENSEIRFICWMNEIWLTS